MKLVLAVIVVVSGLLSGAFAGASGRHTKPSPLQMQLPPQFLSPGSYASPLIDCSQNRTARACAQRRPTSLTSEHFTADPLTPAREEQPVPTGADIAKLRPPVKANSPADPSGVDLPLSDNLALNVEVDLAKEPTYLREIDFKDITARTGVMWRF